MEPDETITTSHLNRLRNSAARTMAMMGLFPHTTKSARNSAVIVEGLPRDAISEYLYGVTEAPQVLPLLDEKTLGAPDVDDSFIE